MSDRGSRSSSPRACSGLIDVGVPAMKPSRVTRLWPDWARARPKSVILARFVRSSIRILPGLTSRWIKPAAWAACRASATSATQAATCRGLGPVRRGDRFTQGPTRDVLHHQVRQTVRRVDHRVNHHDVIVLEARGMLGLAHQSLPVGLFGLVGPEHLESNQPMQRLVPGAIDDPHASAAQLVQQAIGTQPTQVSRRPGRTARLARRIGGPSPEA